MKWRSLIVLKINASSTLAIIAISATRMLFHDIEIL